MNIKINDIVICVKSLQGICSVGKKFEVEGFLDSTQKEILITYTKNGRRTWVEKSRFELDIRHQRREKLQRLNK